MLVQALGSAESTSVLDVLDALSSIASTVVAAAALYATARLNTALRRQEQVNNIPRLFLDEYADGRLSRPVQVPDLGAGATVSTLREAREHIRCFASDPAAWEQFLAMTKIVGNWENRIAYEFSLALQKLGASVFVGAIPLDFVLATGATQIITDWGYCHQLVERIRTDSPISPGTRLGPAQQVGYHRRHAEWLAYVAAVWLHQTWRSVELTVFLNAAAPADPGKGRDSRQIALVRKKLLLIQEADRELLSDTTERQLRRILRSGEDW